MQKQLQWLIFILFFFKIEAVLPSSKSNCPCLGNSPRRRNSVFSFKYQQNRFNYKRLYTFSRLQIDTEKPFNLSDLHFPH